MVVVLAGAAAGVQSSDSPGRRQQWEDFQARLRQGLAAGSREWDQATAEAYVHELLPPADPWMRANPFGYPGVDSWVDLFADPAGAPMGAQLTLATVRALAHREAPGPSQFEFYHEDGSSFDPMSSVMRTLARHPDVDLGFWSSPDTADHTRAQWLLRDRSWAWDGFDGVTAALLATQVEDTSTPAQQAHVVSELTAWLGNNPDISHLGQPAQLRVVASLASWAEYFSLLGDENTSQPHVPSSDDKEWSRSAITEPISAPRSVRRPSWTRPDCKPSSATPRTATTASAPGPS